MNLETHDGPTIVSYGGGTNSCALLIEMRKRDILPDVILFANTGAERPRTMWHIGQMQDWLRRHNFPQITTVEWIRKTGEFIAIDDQCEEREEMPSATYGMRGCSTKWKVQPMDKHARQLLEVQSEHEAGRKVVRVIGIDSDEAHRAQRQEDELWRYVYPLVDWDIGRDECVAAITRAGLPQPGKSSCYLCPHMKAVEVRQLAAEYPELAAKAIRIERTALPNARTVKGLGRSWAWEKLLATDDFFGFDESDFPSYGDGACASCST